MLEQSGDLFVPAAMTLMTAMVKMTTATVPALAMLKRCVEVAMLCRSTEQVFTLYFACLYDCHGNTYFIKFKNVDVKETF